MESSAAVRPCVWWVRRRLTRWRAGALDGAIAGVTGLVYVFLVAPIIVVVIFSLDRSQTGYIWTGFATTWYRTLFHDSAMWGALHVSLVVGATGAAIATILGTMSGYAMARREFPGRSVFSGLVLMPLVVPEIVLAVSLLVFLIHFHTPLGYFSLIIGHVVVVLPYATLILFASISGLNQALEEAAADLGANPWQVFLRIILPLLLPGIITSFILAFLVSFDDIVMSTFVSGIGTTTLPLLVYSMLKMGISPEVNALGTLLVTMTMVLVITTGVRQATVRLKGGREVV